MHADHGPTMTAAQGARLAGPLRIAIVSTYVPRRCGIATFTRSLVDGLRPWLGESSAVEVVALDGPGCRVAYPPEVRGRLRASRRSAYGELAAALRADGVDVLSIQHEYGIFGGRSGVFLLDLLDALEQPVVTTLHTILVRPTPLQARILRLLAERSARLVAMTERGRDVLVERYDIDPARVVVIPHGVPAFDLRPDAARAELGLGPEPLILSSGLLGPHKRVELVLEAIARIGGEVPDVRYAVVGATHPDVVRHDGERYRRSLHAMAERLGLDGRVDFVDRYVSERELATWLVASDIFVTPYADAQQVTSGTLAYALAAGNAVVATPYAHALELLAGDRGVIVPFEDPDALAGAIRRLLTDEAYRAGMALRAREHGRSMRWSRVALRHGLLLQRVASWARPGSPTREPGVSAVPVVRSRLVDLPVSRTHLAALTGDLGIYQFARGSHPDPRHGVCTDDVARALLVDLRHARLTGDAAASDAVGRDLAFLSAALDGRSGRMRNLRAASGRWLDRVGSEDAHGRAVQALGAAVRDGEGHVAGLARELLLAVLPAAGRLRWARPRAYAMIGCAAVAHDPLVSRAARAVLVAHVGALEAVVDAARRADPAWPWPEDALTYDNGVLAEGLIVGGVALGRPATLESGLGLLDWLLSVESAPDGHLRPIGNRGWWRRGGEPARWDQQPVEAGSLVAAAAAAWEATGDARWALAAERGLAWFLGANDLGIPLADPHRGACCDGLGPDGVNRNEGAESTLAWLLSVERVREIRQGRSDTRRISGRGHERTYASTSDRRAVARATVESAAP